MPEQAAPLLGGRGAERRCWGSALLTLLPPLPALSQRGYGEGSFLVSSVPAPERPGCAVRPEHGSVLTAFRVSCSAAGPQGSGQASPSRQLKYCFYVTPGKSPGELFGFSLTRAKAQPALLCRESALCREGHEAPALCPLWCLADDPFFPVSDSLLDCSPDPELFPVYLPLGEEENNFILHVTIIVSNDFGDTAQTSASVKVRGRINLF